MQNVVLLTLCSELAVLHVVIGESDILRVLVLAGPDLTLYKEDAGIFVIFGRKLLPETLRFMSICLIAISKDLPESDLPKFEPSRDGDDFRTGLLPVRRSSCFGGAGLRMFTALSTILVPLKTGFGLSVPL